MRRRTKAVESEPAPAPRLAPAQSAIADDASAKQGSNLRRGYTSRERIDEVFRGHEVFGIAAVDIIASEARGRAQIFVAP
jgi:hypothetical protein